jgi:clan AA aspartic protease
VITGAVNAQREPLVRLTLHDLSHRAVPFDAIIDTGFNHELTLPPEMVRQLGLEYAAPVQATLAGDVRVDVDCYRATIEWQGQTREVAALESEGAPLVGTELLNGNLLSIQVVAGGSLRIEELPRTWRRVQGMQPPL